MGIRKKIVYDMILNIIAVAIPIAILQLLVYPITAERLGGTEYGLMLTIYSMWIMISNSLGNVLNNIRLLNNTMYEDEGVVTGDFAIILKRWSIINAIVVFGIIIIYCGGFHFIHVFLGTVVAALILLKAYLEVGFRIKLNYKYIVYNNLLQSAGFLIGCYISAYTGVWECIFICGYLFSCIFCVFYTNLLKEEQIKTKYYHKIVRESNNLFVASILGNLMNYADKLVLYPLMGGYAVSVYYTATILGKIVGMLTSPINNVILSYIVKYDVSQKGMMYKALAIGSAIVLIGYGATILAADPILSVLFPKWVDEVLMYLPVTTITVCLMTLIAIIQPFVLKFCDMKWQIIIMGSGSATYFVSALILWNYMGLMGFCLGTVIGAAVKLLIMLIVYQTQTVKINNGCN